MKRFSFLLFTIVLLFIGCKDNKKEPKNIEIQSITLASLSGDWKLITLNNIPVDSLFKDNTPYIQFDTVFKQINGYSGCNNFASNVTIEDNKIIIGSVVMTKMLCDFSNLENKFIDAIIDTSMISLNDGTLVVSKKEEKLEFKR